MVKKPQNNELDPTAGCTGGVQHPPAGQFER